MASDIAHNPLAALTAAAKADPTKAAVPTTRPSNKMSAPFLIESNQREPWYGSTDWT